MLPTSRVHAHLLRPHKPGSSARSSATLHTARTPTVCTLAPRPTVITSTYRPQGWTHTWACSTAKLGYSGVSVATRQPPLSVMVGMGGAAEDEHEAEGRVVTVELPELFVVSCYVPNRCAPVHVLAIFVLRE